MLLCFLQGNLLWVLYDLVGLLMFPVQVMELEEQLRIMNIQRRKAEQAAMEAVSILETNGINDLSDAIDSSSDKDESPIAERRCKEDFGESEVCTKANEERIVVGDTGSNSYLEDSSSQVGSLSWKSHSSSPDSSRKTKGKQDRPRQRRNSFISYVESSPKYNLGKSCRKIKRKEVGYAPFSSYVIVLNHIKSYFVSEV